MKATLMLFGLLFFCCYLQANGNKPTPRERFLGLNPDYRQRAGDSYRSQYLPSAARSMTFTIDHTAFADADARRILGTLIDGFLEKFIDGGGTITRMERTRLVLAMDKSVRAIVKDDAAFARYRKWRRSTSREVNSLSFLMTAEELSFPLSKRLVEGGWTVKPHRISELEKFAGFFGEAPDHALLFENPALSKDRKRAWVLVLAFQAERMRDRLMNRTGPFRAVGKKLPPIDFFWQASGVLYFAAEGDFAAAQAQVASFVRGQLVGHPRFESKPVPVD